MFSIPGSVVGAFSNGDPREALLSPHSRENPTLVNLIKLPLSELIELAEREPHLTNDIRKIFETKRKYYAALVGLLGVGSGLIMGLAASSLGMTAGTGFGLLVTLATWTSGIGILKARMEDAINHLPATENASARPLEELSSPNHEDPKSERLVSPVATASVATLPSTPKSTQTLHTFASNP